MAERQGLSAKSHVSTRDELPDPQRDLEPQRLLGAWYLLVTNLELWRGRIHPRIDYHALAPTPDARACVLEAQRFRAPNLVGRMQPRLVVRTNVAARVGQFSSRGRGLRWLIQRRSSVALTDAAYRWTVTWYTRSSLGASPGLCVCTRDPWISQGLLDQILARVRDHAFLGSRCDGLFAPEHHWIPPQPYQLE